MKGYTIVILCLLLVNIGMTYNANAIEVKIISPGNGTIVTKNIELKGMVKANPAGQALWIFVSPLYVNRYYPQDKRDFPIAMKANQFWSTKAVIGSDTDNGLQFSIFAVVTDEKANKEILDYLDKFKTSASWPGLEKLPDGAVIYDKITVTRKKYQW
jgi:hypothetical protein